MAEQIIGAPAPALTLALPQGGMEYQQNSFVVNELFAVQGQLQFLYELMRELFPEKKFNEAQAAVQKRAEEEAKKAVAVASDPRVDELVQQMNGLTSQLPQLIAAAITEALPRNVIPLQHPREPERNDEEMDFGEEPQPEEPKNARRRR